MRLKNQQGMTVIDFAERYNQAEIASGLKSRWQKQYPQTPIVLVSLAEKPDRFGVIDGYKRMTALE